MTILHPPRLPRRVLAELEGTDWRIERGRKHWLLIVNGRQALVFSHNGFVRNDHGTTTISAAAIRRFKRREGTAHDFRQH